MKKIFVFLLVSCFFAVSLSYAEVFEINYMRKGTETLKAREKSSGKDLWQSKILTQKMEHKGETYLYIKEEGAGIYGKDKKYKSWVSEAYYTFKEKRATPYQTKLVYRDGKGKIIHTVNKYYDLGKKKVICRVNGEEKVFKFKNDLIDKELLGTALQNYPFDEKRDVAFYLLTNEPTLYKITVKYRGQETIKVGKSMVKCHKLQMIPDLGLLNLLGAFVPKTYFWYKTTMPYSYVRYEGLESGLGTPYIVLDSPSVNPEK